MIKPPAIVRFEQFYWASVLLGLINTALNWNATQVTLAANPILASAPWFLPAMQIAGLLIAVLIWFSVARRASVVGKWVQVVIAGLGAFGILSALVLIATGRSPLNGQVVIGLIANILYIAAAVMLFKPEAKAWFGEGADDDDFEAPRA